MKEVYIDPMNKKLMFEPVNNDGTVRSQYKSPLAEFVREYNRILVPSGFLFMWIDELEHLFKSVFSYTSFTQFIIRNFITWDIGEISAKRDYDNIKNPTSKTVTYKDMSNLVVMQKHPNRTDGHWFDRWVTDYYSTGQPVESKAKKPVDLQAKLIKASTLESDLVVDAAAGSFSVLKACKKAGRNFLGCDIR